VKSDADLASDGSFWFGHINEFKVIKAAGRTNLYSLHSCLSRYDETTDLIPGAIVSVAKSLMAWHTVG
jgi:hypothetical protein